MLESDISSGFEDLERQFLSRVRTEADERNLYSNFFTDENYLAMCNGTKVDEHMVLAIFNGEPARWVIYLRHGSKGRKLIEFFNRRHAFDRIADALNDQYRLCRSRSLV